MCGEVCGGEKIKKLFVETTITESDGTVWASQRSAIAEYLHMVAMVSGEEASEVEVENVRTRVNEWAASLPQNLRLQVSGYLFTRSLPPSMDLRSRFALDSIVFGVWRSVRGFLTMGNVLCLGG